MIFWGVLILCVIGLIVGLINDWFGLSFGSSIIGVFWLIIAGVIIVCAQCDSIGKEAELKETYKALNYKLESGSCRDEFGIMNKEFIDEIQEWNEDIIYYKETQDNFWIGIFIPNIYDNFETIDYDEFVSGR